MEFQTEEADSAFNQVTTRLDYFRSMLLGRTNSILLDEILQTRCVDAQRVVGSASPEALNRLASVIAMIENDITKILAPAQYLLENSCASKDQLILFK